MLKKEVTYKDFNGVERTEELFFHLSKAELSEMDLTTEGGLSDTMRRMVSTQDHKQIFTMFKTILMRAYGEKSPDGRRFMKSPEISKAFEETNAYDAILMELLSNGGENVAAFINGIIPEDLRAAN